MEPTMLDLTTNVIPKPQLSVVNQIKQVSVSALLTLSVLTLTACQNSPSNVHATPTKPISMPQSAESAHAQINDETPTATATTTTKTKSPNKVIFIDVPPTTVPTTSPSVATPPTVTNLPTTTTIISKNTADILTAPSQTRDDSPVSPIIQDNQLPTQTQTDSNSNQIDSRPTASSPTSSSPSSSSPDRVPNSTAQQPSRAPTPTVTLPEPDRRTPQEILLERARSNSQTSPNARAPVLENGDNVPAFRRLMQTGIGQLQNGDYNAADSTFTRAQRLAPQSSAVYFYLGQVAIKRNQPRRAEAMARRGLVVAQSDSRRRGLWQVILLAGEQQQSQRVISEAQAALAAL